MFRKIHSIEFEVAEAAASETKRRELVNRTQKDIRGGCFILVVSVVMIIDGQIENADFWTGIGAMMFCSSIFSLLDDRKRLKALETGIVP